MQHVIHLRQANALHCISEGKKRVLILKSVDEVVTVGLLLRWHTLWCFILGRRAAISQQKTAVNSDPVQC